jgi:RIO kinase 1
LETLDEDAEFGRYHMRATDLKAPKELQTLIDDGVIDEVLRRLQGGKEASVYTVGCGSEVRCAKVYKQAEQRGFHNLARYQEGRKTRGSRDTRALGKHGRHGRRVQEEAWQNAEIQALYRLAAAGVRVPVPYGVYEGVLLMELVRDGSGHPAPRLNDVDISPEQARLWHRFMIEQIVLMLCSGLIHGDLSEFNILVDSSGPVIIDLPQAVNAAANNSAFRMLERDVNNMRTTFGRSAPELLSTDYALELWSIYQSGELRSNTALTGRYVHDPRRPDVEGILEHIETERREAEAKALRRKEAESA